MKNLVLSAAMVGAASLATACTSSSSLGNGTADVAWHLQDWNDASGAPVAAGCPAGATTAIVWSLPTSESDTSLATKDLFNCADGGGQTDPLFADNYNFWVTLTDDSGAVKYAESGSVAAPVNNGIITPVDFTFQVNRGYVTGAWALKGGTSGSPLDCASAHAAAVEFSESKLPSLPTPISDQFNCTAGHGTTDPIPVANYQFTMQAINSASPPKALGPAAVGPDAIVQWGNQTVNEGTIVLSIDGL